MAESTASKNERLSDFALDATSVSLHSADPGTTGASELTGGSPAYAKKTPTWSTPAAGAMNLASSLTFDVPSGGVVAYYGLWKGATFLCGGAITGGGTYSGQGTFVLSSIPVTA